MIVILYWISIIWRGRDVSRPYHVKSLGALMQPSKKPFYHQGFFAVKRRAVFILVAMWKTLVRGWRRDCVVGSMETRFQWRKAHSRSVKCEAFHVAPRLFFMFLFLITFTIRQQCIIYPQDFSTKPKKSDSRTVRQVSPNSPLYF